MQDPGSMEQKPASPSFSNDDEARLRLRWRDVITNEVRAPFLKTPIGIGREFAQIPSKLNGRRLARVVFESAAVSRYHALIDWVDNQVMITDQSSANGTFINGHPISRSPLQSGDTIKIGPYLVSIVIESIPNMAVDPSATVVSFNDEDDLVEITEERTRFITPEEVATARSRTNFDSATFTTDVKSYQNTLHNLDPVHQDVTNSFREQQQLLDQSWYQLNEKIAQLELYAQEILDRREAGLSIQTDDVLQAKVKTINAQIAELQDLFKSTYQKQDGLIRELRQQDSLIRELRRELQNTSRFFFLGIVGIALAILATWFFVLSR